MLSVLRLKRWARNLSLIVFVLCEATKANCPDPSRCSKCKGWGPLGCDSGCCSSANWCGHSGAYCSSGSTRCECDPLDTYITTTATPNWVTEPSTGEKYWINPTLLTWDDSLTDCQAVGGSLVKLNSGPANQKQVDFLTSHMADSKVASAWIGCNDKKNEGTFVWTDGTPCIPNWGNGEPNNAEGHEHCVELMSALCGEISYAGQLCQSRWNDLMCTPRNKDGARVSICQLKTASTTPTRTSPPCDEDGCGDAATCEEARDDYGATLDGYYTLSLKVDAALIDTYEPNTPTNKDYRGAQGCGIRTDNRTTSWDTRLTGLAGGGTGGYTTSNRCLKPYVFYNHVAGGLKVIRKDFKVWCHFMGRGPKAAGESPRAYIGVDPLDNTAQFQYGATRYTTFFSKLRFHETMQLIYTADYTFATTSVVDLVGDIQNPCDQPQECQDATGDMATLPELRCDSEGNFHVPFGTAGACLQYQDPNQQETQCAAINNRVPEAIPEMNYNLGDKLYVMKYGHTNGRGGGRQGPSSNYAGSTFLKHKYASADYLEKLDPALRVAHYVPDLWNDDDFTDDDGDIRSKPVSESGSRRLKITRPTKHGSTICIVAGPEVGNMKEFVADLEDEGMEIKPDPKPAIHIGVGGWGLPLCLHGNFGQVPYVSTSDDPDTFEEVIPLNCVRAQNVQDTKFTLEFIAKNQPLYEWDPETNYATGRIRPRETGGPPTFGLQQHFYTDETRTKCNPETEDVDLEPPLNGKLQDRTCKPKPTTTTSTITTTTPPTTPGDFAWELIWEGATGDNGKTSSGGVVRY